MNSFQLTLAALWALGDFWSKSFGCGRPGASPGIISRDLRAHLHFSQLWPSVKIKFQKLEMSCCQRYKQQRIIINMIKMALNRIIIIIIIMIISALQGTRHGCSIWSAGSGQQNERWTGWTLLFPKVVLVMMLIMTMIILVIMMLIMICWPEFKFKSLIAGQPMVPVLGLVGPLHQGLLHHQGWSQWWWWWLSGGGGL